MSLKSKHQTLNPKPQETARAEALRVAANRGGTPLNGARKPLIGTETPLNGGGQTSNGGDTPLHGGGKPVNGGGRPVNGRERPLNAEGKPLNGEGPPLPCTVVPEKPLLRHLGDLTYLDACLRETLRLYCPIHIGRICFEVCFKDNTCVCLREI